MSRRSLLQSSNHRIGLSVAKGARKCGLRNAKSGVMRSTKVRSPKRSTPSFAPTVAICAGLGFGFQDRGELFTMEAGHPNVYAPGKRPFHTLNPGFVWDEPSRSGGCAALATRRIF